MRNWSQTVLSQYSNSTRLLALLGSIDDWISPDTNFEQFYDLIWNVDSAVGYGLDVWGRIVGVNRVLTVDDGGPWFGFNEQTDSEGFNQGAFWNGTPVTSNFVLSDDAYRNLIFAKAAANITDGSIPSINAILMNLFPGRGNAYVIDGANAPSGPWFGFNEQADSEGFEQAPFWGGPGELPANMTMTYTFTFVLQPFEVSIVTSSGVLPKSTGVQALVSYPSS